VGGDAVHIDLDLIGRRGPDDDLVDPGGIQSIPVPAAQPGILQVFGAKQADFFAGGEYQLDHAMPRSRSGQDRHQFDQGGNA